MPAFGMGRDIFNSEKSQGGLFCRPASSGGFDLRLSVFGEVLKRMSNPKPHYNHKFVGVLWASTFAKRLAATGSECQNQTTRPPYSALRGCRRGPMIAPKRRPRSVPP